MESKHNSQQCRNQRSNPKVRYNQQNGIVLDEGMYSSHSVSHFPRSDIYCQPLTVRYQPQLIRDIAANKCNLVMFNLSLVWRRPNKHPEASE